MPPRRSPLPGDFGPFASLTEDPRMQKYLVPLLCAAMGLVLARPAAPQ